VDKFNKLNISFSKCSKIVLYLNILFKKKYNTFNRMQLAGTPIHLQSTLDCVLLIDDDEATLALHKEVLEICGVTQHVRLANSGFEALSYLRACIRKADTYFRMPDLILLDLDMPQMTGWQFAEIFGKIFEGYVQQIPLIVLSNALPRKQAKPTHDSIADFFCKPLTPPLAEQLVERYSNCSK